MQRVKYTTIIEGHYILKGKYKEPTPEIISLIEDTLQKIPNKTDYKLENNILNIIVESKENETFAYEVFMQIKNKLREALKSHRIGLKNITVDSAKLQIPLDPQIKQNIDEVKGIKIEYVNEIRLDNGYVTIIVNNLDEWFLKNQFLRNIPKVFMEKLERIHEVGKKEFWELLWTSRNKCSCKFTGNPTNEAVKRGWLKKFPMQGVYFFTPKLTAIFKGIENLIEDEILKPLKFEEAIFPKQIPLEIWRKTGHLTGVCAEVFYLSPAKTRDPSIFEDINDIIKITNKIPVEKYPSRLREPIGGYIYAQCPPFYWFFEKEIIPDDVLPIKWFDRSGPSFRWESGGLHGFERLNEFHRIELVWLDSIEGVISIRDKLMDCYKHIFEDILELEWRMAKVTPWYYAQSGKLTGTEVMKEKGTIDYESYLPYRGPRETSEWLEFQNISIHGDKFVKAFKMKSNKNTELWTGCSGIGLERWVVTLIAQYGLDLEEWPSKFQPYLKHAKEISETKLITWP
ncbi:MAG: aminoacyl--tRNA ligase-related protein [Promethearchaeota archaeon]